MMEVDKIFHQGLYAGLIFNTMPDDDTKQVW